MTKWQVQRQTHGTTEKHVEHLDATDILKKIFFCVFWIFLFSFFIIY